jgi:hypothetical protein
MNRILIMMVGWGVLSNSDNEDSEDDDMTLSEEDVAMGEASSPNLI